MRKKNVFVCVFADGGDRKPEQKHKTFYFIYTFGRSRNRQWNGGRFFRAECADRMRLSDKQAAKCVQDGGTRNESQKARVITTFVLFVSVGFGTRSELAFGEQQVKRRLPSLPSAPGRCNARILSIRSSSARVDRFPTR